MKKNPLGLDPFTISLIITAISTIGSGYFSWKTQKEQRKMIEEQAKLQKEIEEKKLKALPYQLQLAKYQLLDNLIKKKAEQNIILIIVMTLSIFLGIMLFLKYKKGGL